MIVTPQLKQQSQMYNGQHPHHPVGPNYGFRQGYEDAANPKPS